MNTIKYSINDLMSTLGPDDSIEQYDLNDQTKELYFTYLESLEDDSSDPYYCWCGYCYDCNNKVTEGTILMAKVDNLNAVEWIDCICKDCADIYKQVLVDNRIKFCDHTINKFTFDLHPCVQGSNLAQIQL